MTIRLRLIGLVVITNIFLIISLVYVNIQSAEINAIRDEQALLSDMHQSLNAESNGLMDFLISSFNTSIDKYQVLATDTTEAFENGKANIVILPDMGGAISKALESVFRLNDLMIERREEHTRSAERFWQITSDTYLYAGGVSLFRLVTDEVYRRGDYEKVMEAAADFIMTQAILHNTITSNVDVLNRQMDIINSEIDKILQRQTLVMNLSIVGVIILSTILSSLIIRIIIRRVKRLLDDIAVLTTGDLTVSAYESGKDELSELGRKLNGFIENLKDTLGAIQAGSRSNTRARNNLLNAVEDSAGSVVEGERNVESILELTSSLDKSVKDSAAAADLIVSRVDSFTEMIQAQVTMVVESNAAITEITASLSNMSKAVGSNREAADRLETASRDGSEKIEETGNTIRRVSNHVNAIQEMADIIKGVADQTNLLGMNAAIEAAHAGDAGRGFGVVAEEIRKLAETTAENSRIISENLQAIIDDIQDATESSDHTITSFNLIDLEVQGVINRTAEVAASIEELGQGSSQVMEAMNELQEYTTRVKESTIDISENIHSVRNSVAVASDVSHHLNTSNVEIRTGMSVIRESSERTRDVADSIKAISLDLDSAVRCFKTEESTGASLDVPVSSEEDGVTLSEGDWPGKEKLTVVDEKGRPEKT